VTLNGVTEPIEDHPDTPSTEPKPTTSPLVGLVSWCGLALAILAALEVVAIVAQGVAIKQANLGSLYKLGYAFLTNLDAVPLGLILLVAVVLVVLPKLAGQPTDDAHDRQAAFTLGLAASFALLIVIGAILGVTARIRVDHLRSAAVTSLTWRVLISYLIRNMGTALVAFVAAGIALRTRFDRPAETPVPGTVTPSP